MPSKKEENFIKRKMNNKYRGSNFDDFLKQEGLFEECNAEALKKVLAFQIERDIAKNRPLSSRSRKKKTKSNP